MANRLATRLASNARGSSAFAPKNRKPAVSTAAANSSMAAVRAEASTAGSFPELANRLGGTPSSDVVGDEEK